MSNDPQEIIVIGGNGGIGQALVKELLHCFPMATLYASYHLTEIPLQHERLKWQKIDIRDAKQIETWSTSFDRVDWIINCAGYLHGKMGNPEKNIRSIDADFLLEHFKINTLPTLHFARYFAAALRQSSAPILATISARVGSIEDNRLGGWYSYRISKAALNMALKTLSIEWKHSHPRGCIAALHPGTNDTALSKPFQTNVDKKNLFKPSYTASMFVKLLSQLNPGQTGKFWAYDGETIPW